MTIRAFLADGRLQDAVSAAEAAIRNNPLDYRQRTTFFTLLCFIGELDRAEKQLTVLSQEDADAERGTAVYRGLLNASRMRERVMCGDEPGQCLLSEPSYIAIQRQAILHISKGEWSAASEALAAGAAERRPLMARSGQRSGYIADADDRLAPFAELFVQDQYFWLPWEQLRVLKVPRPVQLRDLLWAPVVVELDGGPLQAFMPALYPQSSASADPLVQLGRMTVWRESAAPLSIAEGAKLLTLQSDPQTYDAQDDIPLLELETLVRDEPTSSSREAVSDAVDVLLQSA